MIKNGGHQTAFWITAKQSLPWSLLLPWEPGMSENSQPMLAKPFWDTLKRRSRIVRELFPDHGHSWRRYTQPKFKSSGSSLLLSNSNRAVHSIPGLHLRCHYCFRSAKEHSYVTKKLEVFFSAKLVDQDNGKNGQKKAKSPENTDKNLKTWCT